jgi:hypothetical protein
MMKKLLAFLVSFAMIFSMIGPIALADDPTPTPEPTATVEPTEEPTQMSTPEPTATVEPTAEPTSTPTATIEPTVEPTQTPTPELTSTVEHTTEPTPSPSAMPTPTPTNTSLPGPTPVGVFLYTLNVNVAGKNIRADFYNDNGTHRVYVYTVGGNGAYEFSEEQSASSAPGYLPGHEPTIPDFNGENGISQMSAHIYDPERADYVVLSNGSKFYLPDCDLSVGLGEGYKYLGDVSMQAKGGATITSKVYRKMASSLGAYTYGEWNSGDTLGLVLAGLSWCVPGGAEATASIALVMNLVNSAFTVTQSVIKLSSGFDVDAVNFAYYYAIVDPEGGVVREERHQKYSYIRRLSGEHQFELVDDSYPLDIYNSALSHLPGYALYGYHTEVYSSCFDSTCNICGSAIHDFEWRYGIILDNPNAPQEGHTQVCKDCGYVNIPLAPHQCTYFTNNGITGEVGTCTVCNKPLYRAHNKYSYWEGTGIPLSEFCTTRNYYVTKCSNPGCTLNEAVEYLNGPGHVYSSSCDEICDTCGEKTRTISSHPYKFITYMNVGDAEHCRDEVYTCSSCGKTSVTPDNVHNYEYSFVDLSETGRCQDYVATCKDCGYSYVVYTVYNHRYLDCVDPTCEDCGYNRGTVPGHTYVNYRVPKNTAALCGVIGEKCSVCGYIKSATDDTVHNYTYGSWEPVKTQGICRKRLVSCQDCTYSYVENDAEHTWSNACDNTCNDCGYIRTVDPHTYVSAYVKVAEQGHCRDLVNTCSICGTNYIVSSDYSHRYLDCVDPTCEDCGYNRGTVPGHTYVSYRVPKNTAALCGVIGEKCSVCGYIKSATDDTVHNYTYGSWEPVKTQGICKKRLVSCQDCTYSYVENDAEHTWSNACDNTCNDCGYIRTVDPHTYVSAYVKVAEQGHCRDLVNTCSICGTNYIVSSDYSHRYLDCVDPTCEDCGYNRGTVPGHTYVSYRVPKNTAALCGVIGEKCSVCGYIKSATDDTVHNYTYGSWEPVKTQGICKKRLVSCQDCTYSYLENDAVHTWSNACDNTCNDCGYIRTVDPHTYVSAYVKVAEQGHCRDLVNTCSICGTHYVVSSDYNHRYLDCVDPTCEDCGYNRGTVPGHTYENYRVPKNTAALCGVIGEKCSVCGYIKSATNDTVHNYTYGSWENVKTQGICRKRLVSCQDCTYSYWENDATHNYSGGCTDTICDTCGYVRTALSHSYSYGAWQNVGTVGSCRKRLVTCSNSNCPYSYWENDNSHSQYTDGSWIDYSSSTICQSQKHDCVYCTYYYYSYDYSHSYSSGATNSSASQHYHTCSVCGYKEYEAHSFSYYGGIYVCVECGYTHS